MAKVQVECKCEKCGKHFTVTAIKQNRRDADSFEQWAINHITLCPECSTQARREEERQRTAPANELIGNTELSGTEKQVAWATDIRRSMIYDAMITTKNITDPGLKARREDYIQWIISNRTDARWWIDNRNALELFRIEEAVKEWAKARKGSRS